ncbi:hypothetical protein BDK51DRAFT_49572 [Blyttiomyces helicus]|uniref:Uncharacterized protein n=1 Tax=Blyttiomyces helicus TaxID=388810 RepID=A0A4P9VYS2_9FUNG|nr:hypothetical protein BDK51DRAFT_49572 [Blyttiomyces helicus]|eukprot:RKO83913.1 hypothetical protein BDK51DRAFT_49572 [Blyttiomyces helicus]
MFRQRCDEDVALYDMNQHNHNQNITSPHNNNQSASSSCDSSYAEIPDPLADQPWSNTPDYHVLNSQAYSYFLTTDSRGDSSFSAAATARNVHSAPSSPLANPVFTASAPETVSSITSDFRDRLALDRSVSQTSPALVSHSSAFPPSWHVDSLLRPAYPHGASASPFARDLGPPEAPSNLANGRSFPREWNQPPVPIPNEEPHYSEDLTAGAFRMGPHTTVGGGDASSSSPSTLHSWRDLPPQISPIPMEMGGTDGDRNSDVEALRRTETRGSSSVRAPQDGTWGHGSALPSRALMFLTNRFAGDSFVPKQMESPASPRILPQLSPQSNETNLPTEAVTFLTNRFNADYYSVSL